MDKEYIKKIIYSSGDIFLPESVRTILLTEIIGSMEKTFYITVWSVIHFINGIIIGYLYLFFKYNIKRYTIIMLIIHTCWEFWQILIGMSKPFDLTGRNNLVDSIVDTLLFMLGAYITLKIYKYKYKNTI
jgi:hypothetical protein